MSEADNTKQTKGSEPLSRHVRWSYVGRHALADGAISVVAIDVDVALVVTGIAPSQA